MAFDDLLNHSCSIYHLIKSSKSLGFGIESDEFSYPDEPDVESVKCHFNISEQGTLEQTDDANEYLVVGKVNLPVGTDVRVNDKIIDLCTGITYYAEIPRNIRDHHVMVTVHRKGKIEGAI